MVLEGTVYESSNGTGEMVADSAEQSRRRFALAILYPSCSSRSLHLINYLIYASWLGSMKYHDFAISFHCPAQCPGTRFHKRDRRICQRQ
jgi:hypothetical protein